jgi:hypothetical protein
MTSQPYWLIEAVNACPIEAAELERRTAALGALAPDAPLGSFVAGYEEMLEARDRLYEAWLSQEMDA